jgi:hypothetical protein
MDWLSVARSVSLQGVLETILPLLVAAWVEQAPVLAEPGLSRDTAALDMLQAVVRVLALLWRQLPPHVRPQPLLQSLCAQVD